MRTRVTLNINATVLADLIESNPEVELEIARGSAANLADRIAKKVMNSAEFNITKIKVAADKKVTKLVKEQFAKVGGTAWFPDVTLTDSQKNMALRKLDGEIGKLVKEALTEDRIAKIISEQVDYVAEKHLASFLDRYLKKNLKPMIDVAISEVLRNKLGVT